MGGCKGKGGHGSVSDVPSSLPPLGGRESAVRTRVLTPSGELPGWRLPPAHHPPSLSA